MIHRPRRRTSLGSAGSLATFFASGADAVAGPDACRVAAVLQAANAAAVSAMATMTPISRFIQPLLVVPRWSTRRANRRAGACGAGSGAFAPLLDDPTRRLVCPAPRSGPRP